MTDHDAIAARVRQDRETGTPGPWHQGKDDQGEIDYTDPCSGTCWNVAYAHYHCGYPIDGSSSNARRIAALPDLEAAYLDLYDEVKRLRAERDSLQVQCCMCGKTGLSTIEDGGPECELDDGRWVCSVKCYDRAASNPLEAEAERDALRAEARQWCGHTYTVDGRAALVMAFETAARQWRETYCLASPGSDEEFHAILSGFDTAVGMFRAALKGTSE